MDSKRLWQFVSILMGMASGAISLGQEPAAGRQVQGQVQRPSVFGTQNNILQIPASSFVPRGAATVIGYDTDGYVYRNAGFVDFAWATVTLPSGVDLDFLDLYYCDTNAANDLMARLRAFKGWNDSNIGFDDLISVSSFGSAGCDYTFAPGGGIFRPDGVLPDFDHTVNNDVHFNSGYQYTIVVSSTVTDSTLSFKGVDIWYHRQVSPAPGTATFTDVPTGHPYFRFIEALGASGITAGCGSSNYCPGNAVTRGEMAVFLGKALGLHFPN